MTKPVHILGISAFYHDSAACLIRDGEIIAAGSEERFTRKKGDSDFPAEAVAFCLRQGGITLADLDCVGFYDKPLLKFERILETYLGVVPRGFRSFLMAGPLWIKEKLYQDKALRSALGGYEGKLLYAEHHESHAASAFFPSPFEEAAILTMDGVGEWATTTMGVGRGNEIQLTREIRWPRLPGPALFRLHLLHRLQGQLGRVQGDGPGAVRPAEVRGPDLQAPGGPQGRRLLPAQPEVLQLPLRPHHDQRGLQRPVRRPAAPAGEQAHAEGDGPRALGPGRVRGDHAPDGADRPQGDRPREPVHGRRRRAQLRRATGGSSAKARSSGSSSSPPPATPAGPSAWRSSRGTGTSESRAA